MGMRGPLAVQEMCVSAPVMRGISARKRENGQQNAKTRKRENAHGSTKARKLDSYEHLRI